MGWNYLSIPVAQLKFGNGQVISSHTLLACDYLSMLGLKLNHVGKMGPRWQRWNTCPDESTKDTLLCGDYFGAKMPANISSFHYNRMIYNMATEVTFPDFVLNMVYLTKACKFSISPISHWWMWCSCGHLLHRIQCNPFITWSSSLKIVAMHITQLMCEFELWGVFSK